MPHATARNVRGCVRIGALHDRTPGRYKEGEREYVRSIARVYCMENARRYGPPDNRNILKPGDSVSQMVRFFIEGAKPEVAMEWAFRAEQPGHTR